MPQHDVPGKKVANNFGLFCLHTRLLQGRVACYFELLFFTGNYPHYKAIITSFQTTFKTGARSSELFKEAKGP